MKVFKVIILGFLGIIFGLIITEVLGRIFLPYPLRQINLLRLRAPDLQMDAETDLKHLSYNPFIQRRPFSEWICDGKNPEKMNNEGFRDRDFVLDKQSKTIRIAVMGDSFTEGWMCPYHAAYPFVLQEELGGSYEVMNFGLANRSPLRYVALYNEIVRKYHPDIVVVCLYSNDIAEDEALRTYTTFDLNGIPTKFDFERYFHDTPRMPQTAWEKRKDRWEWFFCKNSRLYPYAAVYLTVDPNFRKRILEAPPKSALDELWKNSARYLLTLKSLIENDHGRFMLAYAPDRGDFTTENPLHRNANIFCTEDKIPFFNGDEFLKSSDSISLYVPNDGHFSVKGHKVFGKLLSEWMKNQM
jgi:hypothetical protein